VITHVYVEGRRFALDPARSIGKGGEADVYDLGDGRAVKVYKSPDHPDYQGLPAEMRAAEERILVVQRKLREFPSGLPKEVVLPQALATDRAGAHVLGYAMPLVSGAVPLFRYADPAFRRAGVPTAAVVRLFGELLRILRALHAANAVVGDFNDANVLVLAHEQPRLIDADSLQFGPFLCPVFTERFVDPLLCDDAARAPRLVKPYVPAADWYAFNALLLQSLLFVGPHGGVYRPSDPARRVPPGERPLRRITIFHPEVQYPKPATAFRVLPDELLHHFHGVFERDERAPFPSALLARMAFTRCPSCDLEHARARCPGCAQATAAKVNAPRVLPAGVACERVFRTGGVILRASSVGGELRVVHHDRGGYRREDGTSFLAGGLDSTLRFRLLGKRTLVGRGGELAVFSGASVEARVAIDTDGSGPAFDTNEHHRFWVQAGRLWRDAPSAWEPNGAEAIGEVLSNQTRIFAGPTFGLGFYRAGLLARTFVFDAERRGLNDDLRVRPFEGAVVEASAALDDGRAWMFLALKRAGRIRHVCQVYSRAGQLEASAEAEPGDGSWLSTLGGKCAANGALFAATDGGIVRVELDSGAIQKTRDFPATEAFVDGDSQLLAGKRALYVVRAREVLALRLT
jgi:hypothetical protein